MSIPKFNFFRFFVEINLILVYISDIQKGEIQNERRRTEKNILKKP